MVQNMSFSSYILFIYLVYLDPYYGTCKIE